MQKKTFFNEIRNQYIFVRNTQIDKLKGNEYRNSEID